SIRRGASFGSQWSGPATLLRLGRTSSSHQRREAMRRYFQSPHSCARATVGARLPPCHRIPRCKSVAQRAEEPFGSRRLDAKHAGDFAEGCLFGVADLNASAKKASAF